MSAPPTTQAAVDAQRSKPATAPSTAADVAAAAAIARARAAQKSWGALSPRRRLRHLTAVRRSLFDRREEFTRLVHDEEGHIDWLETQLGLLQKLGEPTYLQTQMVADGQAE